LNQKRFKGIHIALGVLLAAVLDIVFLMIGQGLALVLPHTNAWGHAWFYLFVFFGAVQLIWQVPAVLFLRRKGLKAMALGVILAASLLVLLNATCFAFLKPGDFYR
jgi:hypothetical protein